MSQPNDRMFSGAGPAEGPAGGSAGGPADEPRERRVPPCRCAEGQEPEWFCKYCRKSFCRRCVGFREVRGEQLPECPECRRDLIELAARKGQSREEVPPAFLPQLVLSPLFPFRKGARVGLGASIALFVVIWGVQWGLARFVVELAVPVSIFILVLGGGFFWLYLVRIIEDTAFERPAHAWPEFDNVLESLAMPLVNAVMVLAVCFLPALVYALARKMSFENWSGNGVFTGLVTLGTVLMPMAVLSTTLFRTLSGVRPVFLLRSIFTVPFRYLAACVLPVGVFRFFAGDVAYVPEAPLYRDLPCYIAGGVYLLMVEAHIIGLVYQTGRHRLKWFGKTPAQRVTRQSARGNERYNG